MYRLSRICLGAIFVLLFSVIVAGANPVEIPITPNLGFYKPPPLYGQVPYMSPTSPNSWGNLLNDNWDTLDAYFPNGALSPSHGGVTPLGNGGFSHLGPWTVGSTNYGFDASGDLLTPSITLGAANPLTISNDSSGNLNLSGGLTVTGAVNSSAAVTNLSGTTAGTVSWSQPFQGTSYKKVILNFTGYENTTATAQTISFPTVFTSVPAASQSCPAGIEVGTDEAILPVSMSNSFTGQCILQGH